MGRSGTLLLSAAVHLLAILAFLSLPFTRKLSLPDVPVPVKVVMSEAAMPLPPKAPSAMQKTQQSVAVPRGQDRPAVDMAVIPPSAKSDDGSAESSMIRPKSMLSDGALAMPRSRRAKQQLRLLAADERTIQLCNIEAMEQIHAWKSALMPQSVVAYATQDLKMGGGSIVADGAAFYAARNWHRLRFECDVIADKVVSFAFSVGDAIPRLQWEANNLGEQPNGEDE